MVDGAGGVIPDVPEDLAKHRRKMPMMIGTTRDESSLRIREFAEYTGLLRVFNLLFPCSDTEREERQLQRVEQSSGRKARRQPHHGL